MNTENASKQRVRRLALGAVALVAAAALVAACGGGGGDKDKTATKASGTTTAKTATTGTPKAGTPGANGTAAAGTPGAGGTTAAGTPGAATNGTPDANTTAGAVNNGTPVPGATPGVDTTPGPGSSPLPGTGQNGADPVSEAEATYAAEADPSVSGGDPTLPQETVGDVPDPPVGATIDSKTIASVDVTDTDLQVLIDLDASKPGIQSTRDVKVGDVIRVGIVVANSEPIVALNFDVSYDKSKVIAPTIINGPSSDRNPDLNIAALGGADAGWICSPTPVGDRDDAGIGDGDPSTGQAFGSCYTNVTHPGAGGNLVVATIEFRVVAKGSVQFSLSGLSLYDESISEFGRCDGDPGVSDPIPCRTAALNVQ